MKKYIIIRSSKNLDELEEMVNREIKEGYIPNGSITFIQLPNAVLYVQTMIKKK